MLNVLNVLNALHPSIRWSFSSMCSLSSLSCLSQMSSKPILMIKYRNGCTYRTYLPNSLLSNFTVNSNIVNHRKRWNSRTIRRISFKSFKKNISTSDTTSAHNDTSLTDDEDLFHEPPTVRFGMLKVTLTIILGLYFGAVIAMSGANFLEEYEIFVKGSDDDDD